MHYLDLASMFAAHDAFSHGQRVYAESKPSGNSKISSASSCLNLPDANRTNWTLLSPNVEPDIPQALRR